MVPRQRPVGDADRIGFEKLQRDLLGQHDVTDRKSTFWATFPPKPPRMHWATYWRLHERLLLLERRGVEALVASVRRRDPGRCFERLQKAQAGEAPVGGPGPRGM